jgi:hypothetical protein
MNLIWKMRLLNRKRLSSGRRVFDNANLLPG